MKKKLFIILTLSAIAFVLKSCKKDEEEKTSTNIVEAYWEVSGKKYTPKTTQLTFFNNYQDVDSAWIIDVYAEFDSSLWFLPSMQIVFPKNPMIYQEQEIRTPLDVRYGYASISGRVWGPIGTLSFSSFDSLKIVKTKVVDGKLDVIVPEVKMWDIGKDTFLTLKGHIRQD